VAAFPPPASDSAEASTHSARFMSLARLQYCEFCVLSSEVRQPGPDRRDCMTGGARAVGLVARPPGGARSGFGVA
jgi:hypothetical protein